MLKKNSAFVSITVAFFILMTFSFFQPVTAHAAVGEYVADIGQKAGRGLSNIVTSPFEVFCNISKDMEVEGNRYRGFFTGLAKGSLYGLRRFLTGVTEVGTFFVPREAVIPRVCEAPVE